MYAEHSVDNDIFFVQGTGEGEVIHLQQHVARLVR